MNGSVKINGGEGGSQRFSLNFVKGGGGQSEIFLKFNKRGIKIQREGGEGGMGGISKNLLISVMNGKRDKNVQY